MTARARLRTAPTDTVVDALAIHGPMTGEELAERLGVQVRDVGRALDVATLECLRLAESPGGLLILLPSDPVAPLAELSARDWAHVADAVNVRW